MAAPDLDGADARSRISAVVEGNSADLLAFFLRRVQPADDAADLLGEALLIIWRRVDAMPTDDREARMWMFGIARHLVTTHGRATRRRSALQDKLRAQLRPSAVAPDGDGVDVQALLTQLSEVDQEIIRLTYWDGFSQKEAALLLGMPEGTLRSRHHRARESLRRSLSDSGLPSAR